MVGVVGSSPIAPTIFLLVAIEFVSIDTLLHGYAPLKRLPLLFFDRTVRGDSTAAPRVHHRFWRLIAFNLN
jgi:hypothetical protein